jgi:PhnB protein
MKLNTYLNFGGNCAEAFRFYEKHLGGKTLFSMTFGQNPDAAKAHPNSQDLILHASMHIGGTEIMASDVPGDRYQPMRSAYLSLSVDTSEEAERIHSVLSDGGEIFMPMQETFFAFRFSMLRDKFGVNWMIIHPRPAPGA